MKTMLVAVVAFFAISASASAHVVTVASGGLVCTGVTVNWAQFPGTPFDLNIAFQDQINGKAVASPYVVAHLSGVSGSKFIPAPAANGVTLRKVTITWTVDGGGSVTSTAMVKPCNCKPVTPPPPTTNTVTTPGQTVTVTTPGSTVTVPGPTVTVTKTVTTPGPTVTVTTPGPTTTVTVPVNVPGPTITVAGPTTTTTIEKPGKPTVKRITRTKIVYRPLPVTVKCPKGYVGTSVFPINKANKLISGKPILAVCKRVPHPGVEATGVTG